jgi:hypothetical protein
MCDENHGQQVEVTVQVLLEAIVNGPPEKDHVTYRN